MKKILALLFTAAVLSSVSVSALGTGDYVIDEAGGGKVTIPKAYTVKDVIMDTGAGGRLREPQDIFIDKQDNIYIADSGNNRIVRLDQNHTFVGDYTDQKRLNSPQGVYAADYHELYIADTGNRRIVHLTDSDEYIEEFVKPKTDMLDETSDFAINKVYLSAQGYLYMIKGQSFMTIDAENEFKGFVGANQTGFNFLNYIIRNFASAEQKKRFANPEPPPYNNFVIADDGMIYAVAATGDRQIKKINSVGQNIFKTDYSTEKITGPDASVHMVDIAVDSQGVITVIDQNSGKLYQYDREGNMLCAFGGKGDKKGLFALPVSIAVNSKGHIYVLDYSTGYIHVFEPTRFISEVKSAVTLYSDGDYDEAYEKWQSVIEIDENYALANKGIAQTLYKTGKLSEALSYYKQAKYKPGYGEVFEEYRYLVLREHFVWIVLGLVLLAAALYFLFRFLHKLAKGIHKEFVFDKGTTGNK